MQQFDPITTPVNMKLSQFKFKLPEDRIAKYPTFGRDD